MIYDDKGNIFSMFLRKNIVMVEKPCPLATVWGVKLDNPTRGYNMAYISPELVFSPKFHQNPVTEAAKDGVIKLMTS